MDKEDDTTTKKTVDQQMSDLAEAGDIEGVTALIEEAGFGMRPAIRLGCLQTALMNYDGPVTELLDTLWLRILKNDSYLLLRAQLTAMSVIHGAEREMAKPDTPMPEEAIEWIDRVEALEDRIAHLSVMYGKFRHTLALDQRKGRADNIIRLKDDDSSKKIRKANG